MGHQLAEADADRRPVRSAAASSCRRNACCSASATRRTGRSCKLDVLLGMIPDCRRASSTCCSSASRGAPARASRSTDGSRLHARRGRLARDSFSVLSVRVTPHVAGAGQPLSAADRVRDRSRTISDAAGLARSERRRLRGGSDDHEGHTGGQGLKRTSPETLERGARQVRDLLMSARRSARCRRTQQRAIASDTVNRGVSGRARGHPRATRWPTPGAIAAPPTRTRPARRAQHGGERRRRTSSRRKPHAKAPRSPARFCRRSTFPTFVRGLIQGVFHAIVQTIDRADGGVRPAGRRRRARRSTSSATRTSPPTRAAIISSTSSPTSFRSTSTPARTARPSRACGCATASTRDAALAKVNSLPLEGGPLKSLDSTTTSRGEARPGGAHPARDEPPAAARDDGADGHQPDRRDRRDDLGQGHVRLPGARQHASTRQRAPSSTTTRPSTKHAPARASTSRDYEGGERTAGSYRGAATSSRAPRRAATTPRARTRPPSEPVLKLGQRDHRARPTPRCRPRPASPGQVEVNFKSDYFPLEKMADSFQIGRSRTRAKPRPPRQASRGPAAAGTAPAAAPAPARRATARPTTLRPRLSTTNGVRHAPALARRGHAARGPASGAQAARSPRQAFARLSDPSRSASIAATMVKVASYMANPDGLAALELARRPAVLAPRPARHRWRAHRPTPSRRPRSASGKHGFAGAGLRGRRGRAGRRAVRRSW